MTVHRVADRASNAPENIERAVQVIGRSKVKRAVFVSVHTGRKQIKTVDEIAAATGHGRQVALNAATSLANEGIIHKEMRGKLVAYRRDPFFQGNRERVLRLLADPAKLAAMPTKRRPAGGRAATFNLRVQLPKRAMLAQHITVDDVDSFRKVRETAFRGPSTPIPEEEFKDGIAAILNERGEFKDWGGEQSDLTSTKLRVAGRRRSAAFAFKGPGKKGKLKPGMMGKNGDQIQRLLQCPAEVFFVQYWDQIDQSVLKQLEQLCQLKSFFEQKTLWYGIIDGNDSNRLMAAYPRSFPNYEFE